MKLCMIKTKYLKLFGCLYFTFLFCHVQALAEDDPTDDIGEPVYSVIDANHVNVATGNLYYQLNDLKIGTGSGTLSHSITISARDAVQLGAPLQGYKDKYRGGIRKVRHTEGSSWSVDGDNFYSIQVSDDVASYDFFINDSGQFINMKNSPTTLTVASGQYVLTRTDGTKVYFTSNTTIPNTLPSDYNAYGYMSKIEYATGLTITIHKKYTGISSAINSVTSNNGLQLKYIYEVHSRPLASAKLSATSNPLTTANSVNWSSSFPSKIIALNNAIETCDYLANTCTLQGDWPEVNYSWPDGMPRAMYIGESTFTVEDAFGVTTTFHHYAHDEFQGSWSPLGKSYFPRINKVQQNTGFDVDYTYKNDWSTRSHGIGLIQEAGAKGVVTSATVNGKVTTYDFTEGGMRVDQFDETMRKFSSYGYKPVNYYAKKSLFQTKFNDTTLINKRAYITVPYEIDTWENKVYLNKDYENLVNKIENKLNGTTTEYFYDTSGRLNKKDSDGAITSILYPYSNTACDNYRYCNKPSSISSRYYLGLGETPIYTSYNYDPNSGQVASVTSPANNQNKIAKTVYSYQQYSARYLNAVGTLATSNKPIWLLSSKFSCQNSNVSGAGCSGNDKVETVYEYGSGSTANNLFLLGKTITSQADGKSLTYCNKYDKYGNTIEESLPKSGITDCNIGRGY
jgi:hypothetical protein